MAQLSKYHYALNLWANASSYSPVSDRMKNLEGRYNDGFVFDLLCQLKCCCANRHLMNWLKKGQKWRQPEMWKGKSYHIKAVIKEQSDRRMDSCKSRIFFSFACSFTIIESPCLLKITCWQFKEIMKQPFSSKHSSTKQTPGFRAVC